MSTCQCCGTPVAPTNPYYPECSDGCAEWAVDAVKENPVGYFHDDLADREQGGWF